MKKIIVGISLVLSVIAIALVVVSCTTVAPVTNPDGTVSQQHVVDPKLKDAAATVNTASPLVPPPWGWIASAAAGIAVSVSQTVANHKNKKSANKWEDVATTIIQGVEAAGEAAGAVKESISKRSETDGNATLVHEVVQKELS